VQNDAAKGYIKDDAIIIEYQFHSISIVIDIS
jgi:hypothetical protein